MTSMTNTGPVEVFVLDDAARAAVALTRPSPTGDVPPEAMVGTVELEEGVPQWNTVSLRETFVELYTEHMRGKRGPKPKILTDAKVRPGDYVYVLDGRVKNPQGNVPFHDIIGWYKSDQQGRAIADSFEYNREHLAVGPDGPSSMLSNPHIRALVYP